MAPIQRPDHEPPRAAQRQPQQAATPPRWRWYGWRALAARLRLLSAAVGGAATFMLLPGLTSLKLAGRGLVGWNAGALLAQALATPIAAVWL